MQEQNRVRSGDVQEFGMERELTDDELAAVCGGVGTDPQASQGNLGSLSNVAGLGQLGNELTSQLTSQLGGLLGNNTGSNQNNTAGNGLPALGNMPGLGSLQNILGNL